MKEFKHTHEDLRTMQSWSLAITGEKRTGCIWCPVGCHLDKVNRFQRLSITHPNLYDYCMDTLELGEFLDYIGVPKGKEASFET